MAGRRVIAAGARSRIPQPDRGLHGLIFSALDPVYRGVDSTLGYFKVAAFIHQGELAAIGYVVDQSPQLADLPEVPRPGAIEDVPPLGPFRTFQALLSPHSPG
ncbi:hypothetical protein [Arthrobacter sp. ISL-72]|uniref:hypothetical protein n=1 Tax=Arthrobacter sp. ISL-72 TaxID=2819114 RepID=UPI001BEAD4D9|nr:hypothetical protein [Arthrobacter sp. ISL-72]